MKNLSSRKLNRLGIFLLLFLTCAAFSETKAQQTEEAMKSRIAELNGKIAVAPNNADLYAERGNLYFSLSKMNEASADADKALQINAQNGDATMLRGRLRYGKKDYDGAIADYSQIIKANPGKYPFVYFQRGEMYEQKGDYEKALADFSKTLEIEPRAATMVGKARARIEAKTKDSQKVSATTPTVKKPAAPESELEKIMREAGITISKEERAKIEKQAAQMAKGIVDQSNKQTSDFSQMTAKLNTQIVAEPNNDNLYALRAKEYLRLKKYDEALADAGKAVELNPKNTNALILRGIVKTEKRDYDGAIADFTQSIKLAPNQGYAYLGRGTAYERKEDYDLAIADYAKAAEVDPRTAQTANGKRVSAENLKLINKTFGYAKDPYSKAYKQFETESDALGNKIQEMFSKRVYNRNTTTTAQKIQELQEITPLLQKQRDINVRALAELPKFNDPLWERVHKKTFVDNIAAIDKNIDAVRRAIKELEQ